MNPTALNTLKLVGVAAVVLACGCTGKAHLRAAEMPAIAQSQVETALEGALEVIIEDSDQGSRTVYFLVSGDRRVRLRFMSSAPTNLSTGRRVRVKGRWDADDTLVVTTIEAL